MTTTGVLDEAYEQLRGTGPEFQGWLSNHGPMAADAMLRLGHGEGLRGWLAGYVRRLEPAPGPRWQITDEEWREPLGDPSRLGDWCALLSEQVHAEPWEQVLARWWPRLLPGAVASATHGLIRTGHAVRALREQVTAPRLDELGQALGYWAARWQPLPEPQLARGGLDAGDALDAVPAGDLTGGVRTRLADLSHTPAWPVALGALRPPEPTQVPTALDALVDAAVTRYGRWAHSDPVMLVHAATAPRAIALALPALPQHLWAASYQTAWAVTAAISAAYRPARPAAERTPLEQALTIDDIAGRAVDSGDEHAIKFTEVAHESHQRGNSSALPSAARAVALIAAP